MRLILTLLFLSACGRPLSVNERAFIAELQGTSFDTTATRINANLIAPPPVTILTPPRTTCQQRIWPPRDTQTVQVSAHAMTVFHQISIREDIFQDDFLPRYPDAIYLPDAMLLAHEMVHVWQWERRDITGYHPLLAAFEHVRNRDPYLFDPATSADYQSFGYEQQGAVMEEYVCCRALAPRSERTNRLHAMLGAVFDLPPLERPLASDIYVPWSGVQREGICDA